MTKEKIVKNLKEELKVKKEIIAIKAVKQAPSGITRYEGQALPGMCALLGEVLKEGFVRYVIKKNMGCFESLTATGTCANLPRDKYLEYMIEQNQNYPMHKDAATLVSYYDKVDGFFKHPQVDGTGIVIGPLAGVDNPDLVLLFVTPHQSDILTRIIGYLGDFTQGFGGLGGCIFNIRYSFVTQQPTFSTSDTAWRMFAGLDESELTYTLPYKKLQSIAEYIKPTAEYVNSFKEMITF
jgi:uncharacterized protein (DUF169 family)